MAAPQIILRDVSDLADSPRNARTHDAAQIDQLRRSILEFGFVGAVAFDNDGLVAGHGRKLAALAIYDHGETIRFPDGTPIPPGQIPAIDVSGWSPDQRRAYMLADNQLALQAGWDEDMLKAELEALADVGFDLDLLGFDADAMAALMEEAADQAKGPKVKKIGNLVAEFMIPPFTVLSARDGWWQERKRAWIDLGIQSEVGRGENLIKRSLQDRLCLIIPGAYQAASDFIAAGRAEGLDDEAIFARAIEQHGPPASTGAKIDGSNRLPVGPALADSMAAGAGTKRGANGRKKAAPMGQDILKGESKFGPGDKIEGGLTLGEMRKQYSGEGGNLPLGRKPDTRAIGTQGWVADKLASGELESGLAAGQSGTSIFDPVLCELAYRWFSPADGTILDPFAGGSVRGIVCAALGRRYVGVDLREEQIDANREQWPAVAARIEGDPTPPTWIVGDSLKTIPDLDVEADMIFSCPPYGDLEVYSDDPDDISTLGQDAFDAVYADIIKAAVDKLKPDRFACFVVGDYRNKRGIYANFVSKTIAAFEAAGALLYNEAILVTSVGSLPIRAAKQFRSTRKLGKTHQNILVFVKGDPRKATAACGPVDVTDALAAVQEDLGLIDEDDPLGDQAS